VHLDAPGMWNRGTKQSVLVNRQLIHGQDHRASWLMGNKDHRASWLMGNQDHRASGLMGDLFSLPRCCELVLQMRTGGCSQKQCY
jgi:hypothetical protein